MSKYVLLWRRYHKTISPRKFDDIVWQQCFREKRISGHIHLKWLEQTQYGCISNVKDKFYPLICHEDTEGGRVIALLVL